VSAANQMLSGIAKSKKIDHFVIFNAASLSAGETIINSPERLKRAREADPDFDQKALEKGLSKEDLDQLSTAPDERTMDYIRRRHWRIVRDLSRSDDFKAYRDSAEMLANLKRQQHQLAVVHTGPTRDLEQDLKRSRALDYFEDAVFGYDRLPKTESDLTYCGLYKEVMRNQKTAPQDSIIITDTPEGVEDAQPVRPRVIAAYLTLHKDKTRVTDRLKEMSEAGADYAFSAGYHVANLPENLFGRRALTSTMDKVLGRLNGPSGP